MGTAQNQCIYVVFADKIVQIIFYGKIHYLIVNYSFLDERNEGRSSLAEHFKMRVLLLDHSVVVVAGYGNLGGYYTDSAEFVTYGCCLNRRRFYYSHNRGIRKTLTQLL